MRIPRLVRVRVQEIVPGVSFREIWDGGPCRRWVRTCTVTGAHVEAAIVAPWWLRQKIAHWTEWQWRLLQEDCALFTRLPPCPMRVLLSGAHGFIGSHLKPLLEMAGCEVVRLVRTKAGEGTVAWDPARGVIDSRSLEGFDAVVHLAGENIASGRWTAKQKRKLFLSRARDTWLLAHALSRVKALPKVVLTGSAVGYFGDRGEDVLTEESAAGSGFLPEVCTAWERATQALESLGVRLVHARFGMVLGRRGGVLKSLLPFFRLGLGGRLGSGDQYWSWIGIDDAASALYHALMNEEVKGPVIVCSPHPLRQKEWAHVLAKHLHRPAFFSLPHWALHLAFGEMAEATMLASARCEPRALLSTGFRFRTPHLEESLSCEEKGL